MAARSLTTFGEGEYGNPSSYVRENGVESYGGGYNPKDYRYRKYNNDYYWGRGKCDQVGIDSGYGVGRYGSGYNPKGYEYEKYNNDYYWGWRKYGRQGCTGSGYGVGGYDGGYYPKDNEYGKYNNDYYWGWRMYGQGGIGSGYSVPRYETGKGKYRDCDYVGGRGKRGGPFKEYVYSNYGSGNKSDISPKEYNGHQRSSVYGEDCTGTES
ncbi:pupal cuticle protein Edg-91-like [Benincasa hispida]|uniref:pupal cuticle protein Edg-91-like n=1 Tax=Benincasa hispida TaxID=102211 RepID=UPI0018FFF9E5|nr:pupal cuticle protein Edg-91-like [Benincasa hispida]